MIYSFLCSVILARDPIRSRVDHLTIDLHLKALLLSVTPFQRKHKGYKYHYIIIICLLVTISRHQRFFCCCLLLLSLITLLMGETKGKQKKQTRADRVSSFSVSMRGMERDPSLRSSRSAHQFRFGLRPSSLSLDQSLRETREGDCL
jgi:hypothetical protein